MIIHLPAGPIITQPSVSIGDHLPASPIITHPSVSISDHLPASPVITQPSVSVSTSDHLPASPIISQPSVSVSTSDYLPASPVVTQPSVSVSTSDNLPVNPVFTQPTISINTSYHLPASPVITQPSVSVSDCPPASPAITQLSACVSDQQLASPILTQLSINSFGNPESSLFPTSIIVTQPSVCGQHPGNPADTALLVKPSSPVHSISGSSTPLIHRSSLPAITSTECTTFHSVSISSRFSGQPPDITKASLPSLHPSECSTNSSQPPNPANLQPSASVSVPDSNITPSSPTLTDNHLYAHCAPNSFLLLPYSGATLTMFIYPGKNFPSSISLHNITV